MNTDITWNSDMSQVPKDISAACAIAIVGTDGHQFFKIAWWNYRTGRFVGVDLKERVVAFIQLPSFPNIQEAEQ